MKRLISFVLLIGMMVLLSACFVEGPEGRRHHDNRYHHGQRDQGEDHDDSHRGDHH